MKKYSIIIFLCIIPTLNAAFYQITDEMGFVFLPSLKTDDYLTMTGGATSHINMRENSNADIFNTSKPYNAMNSTGVEAIMLYDQSHVNIYDGAIMRLNFNSDATAAIYGGTINTIYSHQDTFYMEPVPGSNQTVQVWTPHITFVCDVDSVSYVGNLLTGNWLDGTTFSITLINGSLDPKYTAYDNIRFVPEPATLLLLSIGGIYFRKRIKNSNRGV